MGGGFGASTFYLAITAAMVGGSGRTCVRSRLPADTLDILDGSIAWLAPSL